MRMFRKRTPRLPESVSHLLHRVSRNVYPIRTPIALSAMRKCTVQPRIRQYSATLAETPSTRIASTNVRVILHINLFDPTLSMKINSGSKAMKGNANCVFCRAPWKSQTAGPSTPARNARTPGVGTSEGYVNLAGIAGVSPVRDTSSCMDYIFSCLVE